MHSNCCRTKKKLYSHWSVLLVSSRLICLRSECDYGHVISSTAATARSTIDRLQQCQYQHELSNESDSVTISTAATAAADWHNTRVPWQSVQCELGLGVVVFRGEEYKRHSLQIPQANLSGYRSPQCRPSPGSSPNLIGALTNSSGDNSNPSAPCSPSPAQAASPGNNG